MTEAPHERALARANAALAAGDFPVAGKAFDETAAIEQRAGRTTERSHALRFAAVAWRLAGRPDESVIRARQAAELVDPGSIPAVGARTEEGEALRALGRPADAAAAYARAAREGEAAGMPAPVRAALLRREAAALQDAGRMPEASERLSEAVVLLRRTDPEQALRARIEELTALQAGGDTATAGRLAGSARRTAERAGDHRALGDLDLLAAARALEAGDSGRALASARAARRHALEGTDPVLYAGAAMAVAELAEARGERALAYESLVVGWVTLADLLGREPARMTFEPPLLAQRDRWGPEAFAAVKSAYEQRRRAR